MTLTPGTRLGAYDILAVIGAGGMGEVFRARDTRLQRDIALKVLPDTFVRDPDRLARFRREALVLAALNHPNVAAIFGVEESADTLALVLELVDGPTLADRIEQGPLPLDEVLPIASQLADALESAHEQGVIHRDLKPANIKIRPDGTVKVLDFGLAKALDPAPTSADVASGLTITSPALMTAAGVLLGTGAYMSPEQARGRSADRRSDIWAFGVVLFEMLSGRRPFNGDDVADTLAAVLRAEPSWSDLPAEVPIGVRRLLRRCLQKDPKRRLQHIGDARLELADVGPEDSTPPVRVAPQRRSIWPILAAATMGAAAVGAAAWIFAPAEDPRPVTRFAISVPELAARVVGSSSPVAFSPDGQEIVYVVAGANPGLERRRLNDTMTPERIRGAEGGTRPFFSPDGKWIGFVVGTKLRKVPVAGGSPVSICDVEVNARASWGDDDTIVVARPGLWRVSAAGGKLEPLFEPSEGVGQFVDPYVLPGSKAVLVQNRRPPNPGFIEAIDLQTRSRHRLVEGTSGRLTATGDLLFTRQGQMWAIKFDATRLAVIGSAVPVLEAPAFAAEVDFGEGAYATSSNGSLAYLAGSATASLIWLDRKGTSSVLAGGMTGFRNPRLSPDETRVALSGGNPADVYVFEVGRPGSRLRLTTSGHNRVGAWSPDGQQLAFFSAPMTPQGDSDLFVIPARGGTATRVLERRGPEWADSWSPDGGSLIFDVGPGYSRDLWVLPFGGEARPLVADPKFNERGGAFSPDGHSFAFVSNMSGRDEVYVERFPSPGERVPISSDGGLQPVWSKDRRELFYRQGDALMAVPVQLDPFRAGAPQKRLDMPRALYGLDLYVPEYDVAADGRVITVRRDGFPEIHVVLNWAEELRRALRR